MSLARLFPDGAYRFQLRFERSAPEDFFRATPHHAALIAERRDWLARAPLAYAGLRPEGEAVMRAAGHCAGQWGGFPAGPEQTSAWEQCLALGQFWEVDFLLLRSARGEAIRLVGGVLCFPSSWRLTDKLGLPIEAIHGPVPGLNPALGAGIQKFLAGLKPGQAWLRENWGLSRSPELNQHPDRLLPRLDAAVRIEEVWLRVEYQALVALPASQGILFGIRIGNHPLAEVMADGEARTGLRRALETMPEALAAYKGIAPARGRLIELLVEGRS